MDAKISMLVHAFLVPECVTLTLPPQMELRPTRAPAPSVSPPPPAPGPQVLDAPLSTLDPVALARMCDDFRSGVFKVAGKTSPPDDAPQAMPSIDKSRAYLAVHLLRKVLCTEGGKGCTFGDTQENEMADEALYLLDGFLSGL